MLKKYLKPVAYFIICLLLLNSGLSLATTSLMGDMAQLSQIQGDNKRILICTSQGLKWVSIEKLPTLEDKGGSTDSHNTTMMAGHDCLFCSVSANSIDKFIPYSFLSLGFSPDAIPSYYLGLNHIDAVDSCSLCLKLSRAPPTSL